MSFWKTGTCDTFRTTVRALRATREGRRREHDLRARQRPGRVDRPTAALILALGAAAAPGLGPAAATQGICEIPVFADDFELAMDYELFEEIVVPGCYGAGQATYERSMRFSRSGDYSLLVWSNASPAQPPLNNHANVFKRLASCGSTGRFLYRVSFLVDPQTADEIQTIEGSLQNTVPGEPRTITKIGAIQYQGNPFLSPSCRWAVWTGYPVPGWQIFLVDVCLEGGVWYHLDFDIDWDESTAGRYGVFQLRGGDLDLALDLSGYPGGADERGFEPAFVVTIEDEALDNGCDGQGDFDLKVYFDDLLVTPLAQPRGLFFDRFEAGDLTGWSGATPRIGSRQRPRDRVGHRIPSPAPR